MPPLNREDQGKHSCTRVPVHIPLASHQTLISSLQHSMALHTQPASPKENPAACVYFPSQIHTLTSSKRGGMSGTSAVTIWQKHRSIFWQLKQGLRTIISVPDSSTRDRSSSYISLQPSTLIRFSLSQPCWNFTLPH